MAFAEPVSPEQRLDARLRLLTEEKKETGGGTRLADLGEDCQSCSGSPTIAI